MTKVQNFAEITPNIPFTEFNFYDLYRSTFEKSELGRIKKLIPLGRMAENFGLTSKSMRPKRGRKPYFTPEGKVALMFLKMYTGLSCPRLMEQLNGNIHYQIFCDVIIDPTRPLTNYKLLDDIILELSRKLKIQQQQDILAEVWKPYMENLDTMYTDATCYESEMRYPTDPKLLWEGIEKGYETMCQRLSTACSFLERWFLWRFHYFFNVFQREPSADSIRELAVFFTIRRWQHIIGFAPSRCRVSNCKIT